jgi:hypothetical protein
MDFSFGISGGYPKYWIGFAIEHAKEIGIFV